MYFITDSVSHVIDVNFEDEEDQNSVTIFIKEEHDKIIHRWIMCEFKSKTRQSLRRHQKGKHGKELSSKGTLWKCRECAKESKRKPILMDLNMFAVFVISIIRPETLYRVINLKSIKKRKWSKTKSTSDDLNVWAQFRLNLKQNHPVVNWML